MIEKTFTAELGSIALATDFVAEWLEGQDCSFKIQTQISVALDEVLSNIVHYAFPEGKGSFTIQLSRDPETNMLKMVFTDKGVEFDPLAKDDPDVSVSLEERKVGGLGIFLVKKLMDGVRYHREDGQNILTIYKKI